MLVSDGQELLETKTRLPRLGKDEILEKHVCPTWAKAFGTTDCTDFTDLGRYDNQRNIRLIRAIRGCLSMFRTRL